MQLKSLAKSKEALNKITNILNSTELSSIDTMRALGMVGESYSRETIKSALAQSTLNKAQIKTILYHNGLQGELLETTADEVANAASTNMVAASQTRAAVTTTGFGDAIRGLGIKLKELALTYAPLLSVLSAAAAAYGAYKLTEFVQDWANGTIAVDNYNKSLQKSNEIIENNEATLSEYHDEIASNNSKIEELQKLYDDDTITEAQKAELENLKYQNALLDEKIKKLQQINDEESRKQAKTAVEQFNAEFGGNAQNSYTNFKKNNKNDLGINETLMLDGMSNNKPSDQLLTLKYFTDAYNKATEDLQNGVKGVTQEDIEYYSNTLFTAKEQFSNVSESLWNDLENQKSKLEAVRDTDAFDNAAYENILSWEKLFKNYVETYKNAAQKASQEISITDKDRLSDKIKAINDAFSSLTEKANFLASINQEISNTGKLSADSISRINEAFPEDKYPEMSKALYAYKMELIDESQLFDELENAYNVDSQNYAELLKSKAENDKGYYEALKENYPEIFENLQNLYKDDFKNWKTLAEAKKGIELNLIKSVGGAWQKYYSIFQNDDGTYGYTDVGFKVDLGYLGLSDEETTKLEEELTDKYKSDAQKATKKLDEAWEEISKMFPDFQAPSWTDLADKDSNNNSTDLLKEEFNKKLSLLDHYHQMGYIKDEQYYRELNELNEEYLAGQEKYLDEYRSYSEKIYEGLKQSYKNMLDNQLGYMDQTVSAVTACIDNGIDALNAQKEAVENEYNTRISALENEQKALEEQQKSLEKQKEGIQEQIDAIQKANDARQKAIDLQKKQYELGRAMNQNTKQVYVNGQMVWQTDNAAIRNAGNELNSSLSDAETDKLQSRIDALNESSKAIDSQKEDIQEQIDSLNEELDRITSGIDRQINSLQEYRDKWSEIPSHFEEVQNSLAAVMMLGQDWQAGVLSMDEAMLVNFGSVYTGIQGQIQSVTDASAMQIAQMAGLTCASMGIMSAYTDEQLGIMSESISNNGIIGSEALAELALSGSTSLADLADNVGTSSQFTANALGNIITAANDAREALEKLSSLQESAGLDGITGLQGFMMASDASVVDSPNGTVPVDITLMKRGGVAGAGQSTAFRASHGVRVPAAGLAEELGEDYLVAVKEGEGFIPPEQVDNIQRFLELLAEQSSKPYAMPQAYFEAAMNAASGLKTGLNLSQRDTLANNIVFQSGAFNINLNEMRDVSALGEAIVRELPNIVTRKLNPSL